ncbi:MAG: tyrosine-type recombinase/integrase [Planctomycetaceae bacterium]|nr:tyrosine-type recombinase/integrase [Planctomycetaceae bacterium]
MSLRIPVATTADLNTESVLDFLAWLKRRGLSPRTLKAKRTGILTLWKFAHTIGLVDQPPTGIPGLKMPRKIPRAWRKDEFASLVATAEKHPQGDTLKALLLTLFDTGGRLGAVLNAKLEDYDPRTGLLTTFESKTKTERVTMLGSATREALAKLPKNRAKLIGPPTSSSRLRKHMKRLVADAGLKPGTRVCFQGVRRLKYSLVYSQLGPAEAARHAGHMTQGMERFYYDPRVTPSADIAALIPPPLESEPAAAG